MTDDGRGHLAKGPMTLMTPSPFVWITGWVCCILVEASAWKRHASWHPGNCNKKNRNQFNYYLYFKYMQVYMCMYVCLYVYECKCGDDSIMMIFMFVRMRSEPMQWDASKLVIPQCSAIYNRSVSNYY